MLPGHGPLDAMLRACRANLGWAVCALHKAKGEIWYPERPMWYPQRYTWPQAVYMGRRGTFFLSLLLIRPVPVGWHPPTEGHLFLFVIVVYSLSRVRLFVTLWTAARLASLSFIISQSLLKLTFIKLVMPSNHLILCHPLLLLSSVSRLRVFFQWVISLHQVAKVLELQLQHQSFQWIFRVDFF